MTTLDNKTSNVDIKRESYEQKKVSDIISIFNKKIANEKNEASKRNKGPPVAPKPKINFIRPPALDATIPADNFLTESPNHLIPDAHSNSCRSSLVSEESDIECDEPGLHVKKHKSEHAARELLSTEETFIKQVRLLDLIHKKSISHFAGVPETELSVKLIFRDITPILTFHEGLLEKIKDCIEKDFWEIPEVFLLNETKSMLKLYKAFLGQYETNYDRLNKLMSQDKEFKDLCENVRKESEFILQDCLAHYFAVFSRLQRYELLFKEFRKDLTEDSPYKAKADEVLAMVKTIMKYSENVLSEQSQFMETKLIFDQIEGHLNEIQNTTRLIKHGPAGKISRKNENSSERYLFLLSDRFLICDPMNHLGKYKMKKKEIVLFSIKLQEIEEDEVVKPYGFRIKAEQSFDLCFVSAEEKQEWWNALQTVITRDRELMNRLTDNKIDEKKLGEQAPIWTRDSQSTMCMLCASRFTMINRRHHCRACGKLVCAECSNRRLYLKFSDHKKRICKDCFCHITGKPEEKPKSNKEKVNTTDAEVCRGYLFHRSFMNKDWSNAKRVYCVYFKDSSLRIYERKNDLQPINLLVTLGFQVSTPDNMTEPNSILLTHPNNKIAYYFQADNASIMERWINSFESVLSAFESNLKKVHDTKPPSSESNDRANSEEKSESSTEEEFEKEEVDGNKDEKGEDKLNKVEKEEVDVANSVEEEEEKLNQAEKDEVDATEMKTKEEDNNKVETKKNEADNLQSEVSNSVTDADKIDAN